MSIDTALSHYARSALTVLPVGPPRPLPPLRISSCNTGIFQMGSRPGPDEMIPLPGSVHGDHQRGDVSAKLQCLSADQSTHLHDSSYSFSSGPNGRLIILSSHTTRFEDATRPMLRLWRPLAGTPSVFSPPHGGTLGELRCGDSRVQASLLMPRRQQLFSSRCRDALGLRLSFVLVIKPERAAVSAHAVLVPLHNDTPVWLIGPVVPSRSRRIDGAEPALRDEGELMSCVPVPIVPFGSPQYNHVFVRALMAALLILRDDALDGSGAVPVAYVRQMLCGAAMMQARHLVRVIRMMCAVHPQLFTFVGEDVTAAESTECDAGVVLVRPPLNLKLDSVITVQELEMLYASDCCAAAAHRRLGGIPLAFSRALVAVLKRSSPQGIDVVATSRRVMAALFDSVQLPCQTTRRVFFPIGAHLALNDKLIGLMSSARNSFEAALCAVISATSGGGAGRSGTAAARRERITRLVDASSSLMAAVTAELMLLLHGSGGCSEVPRASAAGGLLQSESSSHIGLEDDGFSGMHTELFGADVDPVPAAATSTYTTAQRRPRSARVLDKLTNEVRVVSDPVELDALWAQHQFRARPACAIEPPGGVGSLPALWGDASHIGARQQGVQQRGECSVAAWPEAAVPDSRPTTPLPDREQFPPAIVLRFGSGGRRGGAQGERRSRSETGELSANGAADRSDWERVGESLVQQSVARRRAKPMSMILADIIDAAAVSPGTTAIVKHALPKAGRGGRRQTVLTALKARAAFDFSDAGVLIAAAEELVSGAISADHAGNGAAPNADAEWLRHSGACFLEALRRAAGEHQDELQSHVTVNVERSEENERTVPARANMREAKSARR